MADQSEREVKLGAEVGFTLPELGDVVEGVVASPAAPRTLDATYYDTPDLRLARWGLSLRYRTGEGTGWTVKLPENGQGPALLRRELSFEGPAHQPPEAARTLVTAFVRLEPLGPVAHLRTLRLGVELRDSQSQPWAEVVNDEVTILDGPRVVDKFAEVEVEIYNDAPACLLEAVVTRLRRAGAGAPEGVAKFVRALGSSASSPPELVPVKLDKGATMADVIRSAMAASLIRVMRHDPGVRIGDDPEDVHQARVGTRRLRSDLRTFRPMLRPDWVGPVRGELRWLGRELGAVRDADVQLERLRGQVAELPDLDSTGAAALVRRLAHQREQARAELLDGLSSPRYVELLDRLVTDAQAPPVLPEANQPARKSFTHLVRRPWLRLEKAVKQLGAQPSDEELHGVRIMAKRCRYAAEAVAPLAGPPAKRFAAAMAEVQSHLGDHHDAVVAEDWLREAAESLPPGGAVVAGELIAIQRREATRLREEFPEVWKRASKKRLRAWLSS